MAEDEAAQYEMPFEYVRQHILPERQNRRADFRGRWWQYARPRPEMRGGMKGRQALDRHPASLQTSCLRLVIFGSVPANDGTLVFARDDDYFFGVLHSRVHEIWALRMGTLGIAAPATPPPPPSRPSPSPGRPARSRQTTARRGHRRGGGRPGGEARRVAQPARTVEVRTPKRHARRTLTALYNAWPAWLDLAHRALDAAVLAAYGWPTDLTDDEILARLLALNLERAGKRKSEELRYFRAKRTRVSVTTTY